MKLLQGGHKRKLKVNLALKGRIISVFALEKNFASVIGVDAPFVSKVVQNRVSLSEQEKQKWAYALGCKVEDLWED